MTLENGSPSLTSGGGGESTLPSVYDLIHEADSALRSGDSKTARALFRELSVVYETGEWSHCGSIGYVSFTEAAEYAKKAGQRGRARKMWMEESLFMEREVTNNPGKYVNVDDSLDLARTNLLSGAASTAAKAGDKQRARNLGVRAIEGYLRERKIKESNREENFHAGLDIGYPLYHAASVASKIEMGELAKMLYEDASSNFERSGEPSYSMAADCAEKAGNKSEFRRLWKKDFWQPRHSSDAESHLYRANSGLKGGVRDPKAIEIYKTAIRKNLNSTDDEKRRMVQSVARGAVRLLKRSKKTQAEATEFVGWVNPLFEKQGWETI